jgi:hypothetical protein
MRKSRKLKLTKKQKIRKNKTRKLRRIKKIRRGGEGKAVFLKDWRIFEYNATKYLYRAGLKPVVLYSLWTELNRYFVKHGLNWTFTYNGEAFAIEDMSTIIKMGNGEIKKMYNDLHLCKEKKQMFLGKYLDCDESRIAEFFKNNQEIKPINNLDDLVKILKGEVNTGNQTKTVPTTPQDSPRPEEQTPKGWVKYIDESQNREYWYNSVTGASQWENPN